MIKGKKSKRHIPVGLEPIYVEAQRQTPGGQPIYIMEDDGISTPKVDQTPAKVLIRQLVHSNMYGKEVEENET